MTQRWQGYGITDIGLVRATNQDAFLIDNTLGLWIVADGMGGHAGGEVASRLAIHSIHKFLTHQATRCRYAQSAPWPAFLQSAIDYANATIRKRGKANPSLKGMGTTVVCIFMPNPNENEAFIAHVGDSRAYLIRNQALMPLTKDHTLLQERIEAGLLPPTTSSKHPLGHVLTRGVGVEPNVKADITRVTLQPTDELLLCSDGLVKMMGDDQILALLEHRKQASLEEQCRALIDEANRQGGEDNTTVVLILASA